MANPVDNPVDNSFVAKLRAMLGGSGPSAATPTPGMLGSGGAAQAGTAMVTRAYKLYAAEAQSLGDEVMPFEQFQAAAMAHRQQSMAQQPQAGQPGQMPPGGLGTGGGLR